MEILIFNVVVIVAFFGLVVFFGAPYVPTRKKWAEEAMDLAEIGSRDTVVDLGSGDGVILGLAAARGAKAIGYEINPILVAISWLRLRKFKDLATVKLCNFWRTNLPAKTSVVYVFIESRYLNKLVKYLNYQKKTNIKGKRLKVVSFGFTLPGKEPKKQQGAVNLYEF